MSGIQRESGIGVSGFLRTRELGHHKSQNPGEIGIVHQRGRVEKIDAIRKVLTRREAIGVWFIWVSVILVTKWLRLLKSQTTKPQRGGRCHRAASYQQTEKSGFEESGIP
jgi:hypothetical protein